MTTLNYKDHKRQYGSTLRRVLFQEGITIKQLFRLYTFRRNDKSGVITATNKSNGSLHVIRWIADGIEVTANRRVGTKWNTGE